MRRLRDIDHFEPRPYFFIMRALFVLVLAVVAVACQPRPVKAPSPPASLDVPSFDADKVDMTFDWENEPVDSMPVAGTPIKLTATDGSGLTLGSLEARAVLYGPLAFTELHLAFDNDEPRLREGTFSIQLPEGAAVSRFAMKIGTNWQEGEVVEREAARVAYESFLHRKVDPAMLERESGNVFRGRVFPILPRQRKEIIISYSHELPRSGEPYRLGLRGLPAIGQLNVQLLVPSQKKAFVVHRTQITPARDFVWTPPQGTGDAVRGGRWAVVRAMPSPATTATTPVDSVAVLVDSSASRVGAAYAESIDKIDRVLGMLGAKTVKVAAFDQEVEPMATLAAAKARKPAGASDLSAALRWAAASGMKRALVVTDGVPSAGPTSASELAKATTGLDRVDVIGVGSRRDATILRAVAHSGVVVDGDQAAHDAIARDVLHAPAPQTPVALANAARTWRDGSLVFAEVDPNAPLRVSAGRDLMVEEAPAPLVERAVAQARIRELGKRSDREAAKREIIDLSTKHRVLSDYTAMLVLETENDYARFRIRRDALADILVVGSRGVVAAHRNDVVVLQSNGNISPITNPDLPPPSLDSDGDGIPDIDDKCPNEPETYNGFDDDDGCPDRAHVLIEKMSIVILQKIMFRAGSAAILAESNEILDALAAAMIGHPELRMVEVGGHTDERGDDAANLQMSQLRAEAVVKALVDRKVPKDRLRARGYGEWCPEDPAHNEEAWARNRRVDLKIVETLDGPTGIELGCENAFQHGMTRPPNAPPPRKKERERASNSPQRWKPSPAGEPLAGKTAEIAKLLEEKKNEAALAAAQEWTGRAPDEVLAWIAEGRALAALGRGREAARAYGSLLDLAEKPEHRRMAAAHLESIAASFRPALELAIEAYRRAALERPEHPSGHRLLAYALAKSGKLDEALDVTLAALSKTFDERRRPGAVNVLRADASLFTAAIVRERPAERARLQAQLDKVKARIASSPSTSVVLTWETDESDLDLLVSANRKDASYEATLNDITTGYGPEAFLIDRSPLGAPMRLAVQQVRRGPQGFAIGKAAVVRHDGAGKLAFDDRPFVIINEGAAIDLGLVQ